MLASTATCTAKPKASRPRGRPRRGWRLRRWWKSSPTRAEASSPARPAAVPAPPSHRRKAAAAAVQSSAETGPPTKAATLTRMERPSRCTPGATVRVLSMPSTVAAPKKSPVEIR